MDHTVYGEKMLLKEEVKALKDLEGVLGEPLYWSEGDSLKYYFSTEECRVVRLNIGGFDTHDVSPVKHLKHLMFLDLDKTNVSNLTPLRNLKELQVLKLAEANIVNLTPLRNLKKLRKLPLKYTDVSDLTPLRDLKHLERLKLDDTNVSDLSPRELERSSDASSIQNKCL